jgi:hypothetical protein
MTKTTIGPAWVERGDGEVEPLIPIGASNAEMRLVIEAAQRENMRRQLEREAAYAQTLQGSAVNLRRSLVGVARALYGVIRAVVRREP